MCDAAPVQAKYTSLVAPMATAQLTNANHHHHKDENDHKKQHAKGGKGKPKPFHHATGSATSAPPFAKTGGPHENADTNDSDDTDDKEAKEEKKLFEMFSLTKFDRTIPERVRSSDHVMMFPGHPGKIAVMRGGFRGTPSVDVTTTIKPAEKMLYMVDADGKWKPLSDGDGDEAKIRAEFAAYVVHIKKEMAALKLKRDLEKAKTDTEIKAVVVADVPKVAATEVAERDAVAAVIKAEPRCTLCRQPLASVGSFCDTCLPANLTKGRKYHAAAFAVAPRKK